MSEESLRDQLGKETFLWWVQSRHAPNVEFLPVGERMGELGALFTVICAVAVEEGSRRNPAKLFDPGRNSDFALLGALAAMDGYLPSGMNRARLPEDRIRSVDLARILDVEPRRIAAAFREVGVPPKDVRFPGGVTKGYVRADLERAYKREIGRFVDEVTAQLRENRRLAQAP